MNGILFGYVNIFDRSKMRIIRIPEKYLIIVWYNNPEPIVYS